MPQSYMDLADVAIITNKISVSMSSMRGFGAGLSPARSCWRSADVPIVVLRTVALPSVWRNGDRMGMTLSLLLAGAM